jgi:glutathione synthase/RimK-type ligase-like ATP-grasp enzyme
MDGSGDFVYTNQVTAQDMANIAELQYAPQIFQALIEKKRELRVILVGQHTFVGAIDASHTDQGRIDWRRLTHRDDVKWTEACLPVAVEQATRRLMQRLGLYYGAADFVVDADDRHIFLEINPAGEWGWLQRDLGFPIAEAIAEILLSPSMSG